MLPNCKTHWTPMNSITKSPNTSTQQTYHPVTSSLAQKPLEAHGNQINTRVEVQTHRRAFQLIKLPAIDHAGFDALLLRYLPIPWAAKYPQHFASDLPAVTLVGYTMLKLKLLKS